ncbi:acyltransferase family protein [Streptomyces sp. NPDC001351]|uniref:acyltransferase family protein n=1 Tax=Streptomyces sp. NPDC001351 TaxID=3364564 RepID=UPI00367A475E
MSVRSFYARRALRLLPVSCLVTAVTLGGAWLFLSQARFAEYAGDALASALYVVNVRLAATGTDYLAQSSPPSPFQHFWSLAVEEQFYLVWPLLLLLTWRIARGRHPLVAVPLGVLCLGSSADTTGVQSFSVSGYGPERSRWTGHFICFVTQPYIPVGCLPGRVAQRA